MDLKALGDNLLKLGLPLLGMAIAGPGGAAIGAALASHLGVTNGQPENVLAALTSDANAVQKAREFELTNKETLLRISLEADTAQVVAVNSTMQTENSNSANEAWYQKAWRPFNGFVVGIASLVAVVGVFLLLYDGIQNKDAAAIGAIPAVAMAVAAILAIPGAAVGITAWHRGVAQVEQVKNQGDQNA